MSVASEEARYGVAPREIRFFIGNETATRTASELEQFQRRLIEAEHKYMCSTGRKPTHLILGIIEFAEYNAMMELKISMGQLTCQYEGPSKMQWRGMDILKSSEGRMMMAVESPVQK